MATEGGPQPDDERKADAAPTAASEAPPSPTPASPQPEPPRSRRYLTAAAVAAIALALDLVTKAWAWDALREGQVVTLIDNWAYFEFGFNTGSAFSLGRDSGWARPAFIGVTLLALGYMVHLARTLPTRYGSAFVSIGLIGSGALGNLHDRLLRVMEVRGELRHGVVDFIKVFYWPGKPWPTFNVADVALVVGVGMLVLFLRKHGDELEALAQAEAQRKKAAKAGS